MMSKRLKVSGDTQLHMTTTYSRNGVGPKENVKRTFNFVVKGMLISSILVGSVITSGFSAFANSNQGVSSTQLASSSTHDDYRDEQALFTNLKMATKVLEAAISKGELTPTVYENVMNRLVAIEAKVATDGLNSSNDLLPILKDTDAILKSSIKSLDSAVLSKRASSIEAITRLQDTILVPISDRGTDELLKKGIVITDADDGFARVSSPSQMLSTSSVAKPASTVKNVTPVTSVKSASTVKAAATATFEIKTTLNGKAMALRRPSVNQNGQILVPMADVFKSLGATSVKSDSRSGTVTAVKGKTTIKVVLKSNIAYVNGKRVTLPAKTSSRYSVTMISSALLPHIGGKAAYSSKTKTVNITTASAPAVVNVGTTINGKSYKFRQPSVLQSGKVLVPMADTFRTLGATSIKSDSRTKTVTAVKGNITIKVTLGSTVAYVNGKKVALPIATTSRNGATLVSSELVKHLTPSTAAYNAVSKVVTINTTSTATPANGSVVNGISVKYGKHTYASKNQSEYTQVMNIVDDAIKGLDSVPFGDKYYMDYLNGDRASNHARGTLEWRGLTSADNDLGEAFYSGVSTRDIINVYKGAVIAGNLLVGKTDPLDGSPVSAYDALVRGYVDCDPDAQVHSAVLDSLGYTTMIVGGFNHADLLVKLNGSWFMVSGGDFVKYHIQSNFSKNGLTVISQPTDGSYVN